MCCKRVQYVQHTVAGYQIQYGTVNWLDFYSSNYKYYYECQNETLKLATLLVLPVPTLKI